MKTSSTDPCALLRYKAWTNRICFATVASLPETELMRPRATRFGNILHTLNHAYVVEQIFRAHVEGVPHGHEARNTPTPPPLDELRRAVEAMDAWWIRYASSLNPSELDETIDFAFVDGGAGSMTRAEIFIHLVIHATYHRGFVGDMLNQASVDPAATDFTVYLRDVANASPGVAA